MIQRPSSVLVVDDERITRVAALACLRAAGHRACAACNGLDALAAAHGDRPDTVVIDAHSPLAPCLETARALQQNCWTCCMKVAIRSAMTEPEVRALFPVCDAFVDERSLDSLVDAVAAVRRP